MRSFISLIVLSSAICAGALFAQQPAAKPPAPRDNAPAAPRADASPGLVAEHLYNGVNRPCIIIVTARRSFGTVTLALIDNDGAPIAPPVEVHPGRVDLAEVFPAVWTLERAAFLQMVESDSPVGTALVLQPLLSRMVPQTAPATRPSGATYSRIVGWIDENQPPPPTPATQPSTQPASVNGSPTGSADSPSADRAAALVAAAAKKPVKRLLTGLRIYPESDVIIHTSLGDIRIALRPDESPNTAWNFLELSRGGFYRDVVFHRIVPFTGAGQPFVIQAGDPTATGSGGPGYWLPIEPSRLQHDFGVISMARDDDPDSNGSQFFICLSREGTARLDGQYCAFGYAVAGAETIKAIASVPLVGNAAEGHPANPPVMKDAELVPAPPRSPGSGRPDARVTAENSTPVETRPARVPR